MPKRFVILIHSGLGAEHYDLMLEQAELLATWQLSGSPGELARGQGIAARRIGDHRAAYLEYEGPVSRNRGTVKQLDKGTYELLAADESRWEFELAGRKLRGRFELRHSGAAEEWTLQRLT